MSRIELFVAYFTFITQVTHSSLLYFQMASLIPTYICSTYPLGGQVTAALLLTTMAALTTTIYATISCRFVVLTYTIDNINGDNDDDDGVFVFEDYFQQQQRGNVNDFSSNATDITDPSINLVYRTSLGLYQWLRPLPPSITGTTTSITDWTVGTCVGYQQTMLTAFQSDNIMFDLSRIMAIFAILLALFQFGWMFLSACMTMNRMQMYLFILLSACGTFFTGLTFLFHKSTICTTEFENSAYCQIDQGGLVMIAATILWFITFLISIYYVAPVVRVISTADSIDFELHQTRTPEQKQKLALQREIYKELRRQQKEQRNAAALKNKSSKNDATIENNGDGLPRFIKPMKPPDDEELISIRRQQRESVSNNRNDKITQQSSQANTAPISSNYSYDSKESWLRPIPKRTTRNNSRHTRSMSMEQPPPPILPSLSSSSTTVPQRPSSLSRLMMIVPRPLSIPRMKTSDDQNASLALSKIIVEPQETGDVEMQHPESDSKPSQSAASSSIVATPTMTEPSLPSEPERRRPLHVVVSNPDTISAPPLQTPTLESPPLSSPQRVRPTTTTTRSGATSPVDAYIAQRLDNIEKLA